MGENMLKQRSIGRRSPEGTIPGDRVDRLAAETYPGS